MVQRHHRRHDGLTPWRPVSVAEPKDIFDAPDLYLFCFAFVSRLVTKADPMNIIHCPSRVFAAISG